MIYNKTFIALMLVILYRVGIPKVARNLRSIDNTTRNNIPQGKYYISVITLLFHFESSYM